MTRLIVEAIESAEKELGVQIPEGVWLEVLSQSFRKLEYIQKPVDYLPVLFRNELTDYYTRMEINMKGVANYVQRMLAVSVPSKMPQCS